MKRYTTLSIIIINAYSLILFVACKIIINIVLGITIIVSSSLKIQQALILRSFKSSYWLGSLITALLALICGVILLFNPFTGAVVITKVIGLFLIIYAI